MDFSKVQIMVGNKIYPANSVDWVQTKDEYPYVVAKAVVSPYNYAAMSNRYGRTSTPSLSITNVIFNPPATIVFWSDKTKTVVKCDYEHEAYDPEKGIAMAISKKMLGNNKYEYYNCFLHWMKKYKKETQND